MCKYYNRTIQLRRFQVETEVFGTELSSTILSFFKYNQMLSSLLQSKNGYLCTKLQFWQKCDGICPLSTVLCFHDIKSKVSRFSVGTPCVRSILDNTWNLFETKALMP